MKMNLKGWHKIRGSDTHSILRNDEGHQLKIAHGALSDAHRAALMDLPIVDSKPSAPAKGDKTPLNQPKAEPQAFAKGGEADAPAPAASPISAPAAPADARTNFEKGMSFAKGGKVDDVPEPNPTKAAEVQKGATQSGAISPSDAWNNIKSGLGYAKGGKVQKFADGGMSSAQDSPDQIAQDASNTPMEQQMQAAVADAPPQQGLLDQFQQRADDRRAQTQIAEGAAAAGQAASPTPAPIAPGAPQVAPQASPQATSDPYGTGAYEKAYMSGLGEEKTGLKQEAAAADVQGQQMAKDLGEQQAKQEANQLSFQTHYKGLEDERQRFQQDVSEGHIDPNRFMNNKSVAGHISTAIGLLLGGMGAGITGGPNFALDFLNKQIDRDIASQQMELGKKENLLSANMKQFGNMRDASDMTRVMQLDLMSNKLKQAAAQAQGPMAKANALKAAGQLDMQAAPLLSNIAMRKTLLAGNAQGRIPPEQVIRAIVPAGEQEKYFGQLKEAQGAAALRDNTLSAFDQIAHLQNLSNRISHPIDSYQQIEKIKNLTLDKLTKDTSGRVTPETVHLVGSTFADLSNGKKTVEQARRILNDVLSQGMHYPMLDNVGIKQYSNQAKPAPIGAPQFNKR